MRSARPHTWDGTPGMTAEYFRRRHAVSGVTAVGQRADLEALADELTDELGPARARRLMWLLRDRTLEG